MIRDEGVYMCINTMWSREVYHYNKAPRASANIVFYWERTYVQFRHHSLVPEAAVGQ
jgi:hypothetical protein